MQIMVGLKVSQSWKYRGCHLKRKNEKNIAGAIDYGLEQECRAGKSVKWEFVYLHPFLVSDSRIVSLNGYYDC